MELAIQSLIVSAIALSAGCLTILAARNWRGSSAYLCSDCIFNNENDCHKPDRGRSVDCLAYTPAPESSGQT